MNHRKAPIGGKNQQAFRTYLKERDKGKCAVCGETVKCWIADHIIPLWKVRTMDMPDAYYWNPEKNGQTLCDPCNTQKTSAEAAERAHFDRLEKRRQGVPKRKKSRKLEGRGFDKRYKKSVSGTVTERKKWECNQEE